MRILLLLILGLISLEARFSLFHNDDLTWWLNHFQEYFWKPGCSKSYVHQEGTKDLRSEVVFNCYMFLKLHNEVTVKRDLILVRKQVPFFPHRCSNGCLNKNRRKPGRRFSCLETFATITKYWKPNAEGFSSSGWAKEQKRNTAVRSPACLINFQVSIKENTLPFLSLWSPEK